MEKGLASKTPHRRFVPFATVIYQRRQSITQQKHNISPWYICNPTSWNSPKSSDSSKFKQHVRSVPIIPCVNGPFCSWEDLKGVQGAPVLSRVLSRCDISWVSACRWEPEEFRSQITESSNHVQSYSIILSDTPSMVAIDVSNCWCWCEDVWAIEFVRNLDPQKSGHHKSPNCGKNPMKLQDSLKIIQISAPLRQIHVSLVTPQADSWHVMTIPLGWIQVGTSGDRVRCHRDVADVFLRGLGVLVLAMSEIERVKADSSKLDQRLKTNIFLVIRLVIMPWYYLGFW